MSNQEIVRKLIDNDIKLHTVRGVQCVRYQPFKRFLNRDAKMVFNYNTIISFPVRNLYSKKSAILWDTENRVKYIRLDWIFDVWRSSKKEYVFVGL